MEDFEKQQNLSEEEESIFFELGKKIKPLFDSFTKSDDAYEIANQISEFYDSLKEQGYNPKDFYLWSLLAPGSSSEQNYPHFDTEDHQIERFIENLSEAKEEIAA